MARIAHFRKIFKDDFFKKIKFFAEFFSARDILDAAAAEDGEIGSHLFLQLIFVRIRFNHLR